MTNLEYLKDQFLNRSNWNEQNCIEVHPNDPMLNGTTGFKLMWDKVFQDANFYEINSFLNSIMMPIPFEEDNIELIETKLFKCAEDCWNYFESKIKQYFI